MSALLREKEELETRVMYGLEEEQAGEELKRVYHLLEKRGGKEGGGVQGKGEGAKFEGKSPGLRISAGWRNQFQVGT